MDGGALHLVDMDTCEERTLVASGAAPMVRFSHDGTWVAFGDGAIVPSGGGDVQAPVGKLTTWQWSPTDDVLAGVTAHGGVVVGGPKDDRRVLVKDGSGAAHVTFSPNGRSLEADIGGDRVVIIDVVDGVDDDGLPRVAGNEGTAAGRGVVAGRAAGCCSSPGSRDRRGCRSTPCPADGGDWVNVFDPVLPYVDFLSWCGRQLALSGGGDAVAERREPDPPVGSAGLAVRNLSNDFTRSWIWPACSPKGKWIAATATPNSAESPPGRGIRALWLLSSDGIASRPGHRAGERAYEVARWSADGRFILVVKRGIDPDSSGALLLFKVDPSTGKATHAPGPVARIGSAPGADGHADWSNTTDWYRP